MVKVWNSAIDDEENKHQRLGNKQSTDDEEVEEKIRTMIRLDDFNTTLSIWAIESIEKKSRFIEKPNPRWQFGIVINAGIEQSARFPKVDIDAWYEREEIRDQKYELLLAKLETYGFKILT